MKRSNFNVILNLDVDREKRWTGCDTLQHAASFALYYEESGTAYPTEIWVGRRRLWKRSGPLLENKDILIRMNRLL